MCVEWVKVLVGFFRVARIKARFFIGMRRLGDAQFRGTGDDLNRI
jgi:hypothetical protein